MTAMLITDPDLIERLKAERQASDHGWRDEAWDGVYVMSPSPNVEHQWIAAELHSALRSACHATGDGRAFNVLNVSDRDQTWIQNYREPDLSVYLTTNPARNRGTHWQGGGDFVVEILSPGDLARRKMTFYAQVGVREFLVVDRYPWALELYRRREDRLELVGISTVENGQGFASEILPLTFQLVASDLDRPAILAILTDGDERWTI